MIQINDGFLPSHKERRCGQYTEQCPRIRGNFPEIATIREASENIARRREQDILPISFMGTTEDFSQKKLDKLEPSFMYSRILKKILLLIAFEQQHFQQFITYCREVLFYNGGEPTIVRELEDHYNDKTPIYWYTYPCFLYDILNRALRLMDFDIIIHLGFFIDGLHRQIEQLHQEQFYSHPSKETFVVYRGQALSVEQFEKLSQSKGGLLSFNSFLSTSKNRRISLEFSTIAMSQPDMIGILFIILIDPSKSTTPFASIAQVSYFEDREDEVLFSMHTVFRIEDIRRPNEDTQLFEVTLILTSDDDKDLRQLADQIHQETSLTGSGWLRLASLLLKMGQSNKAQQLYHTLLKQSNDETEQSQICSGLGTAYDDQGYYKEAIAFFEKAVTIQQQLASLNHFSLAFSFNNLGNVYFKMTDYKNALRFYEQALVIYQSSYSPNRPDLATSYNNIGSVHFYMGHSEKGLSHYEKAAEIYERSLPPNHPNLATCYNNMGAVYSSMGDNAKAMSLYQRALIVFQKSLPPDHPYLGVVSNNIGLVYCKANDNAEALRFHKAALVVLQTSLSSDHLYFAICYNNIGAVYSKKGDYSEALESYGKALLIYQQTLGPNHPSLVTCYNNIGLMYSNKSDYKKALESYEKALKVYQQAVHPNQSSLATCYNNISLVYCHKGDYMKALHFCNQAIDILQKASSPDHMSMKTCQNNLEFIKTKL